MLGKVLKKGDTIGIIAPASCSSYEKVLEAKKNIGNMGYKVVLYTKTVVLLCWRR